MAEDTPVVQKWRTLLIAGVLSLAVVIIYNVHISAVRKGAVGEQVGVLRVTKDIKAGEIVKPECLDEVMLRRDVALALGDVVPADKRELAYNKVANTSVQKDSWLRWTHVTRDSEAPRLSSRLAPGMVMLTVPLDLKYSPGTTLRQEDYVNLMGQFFPGGSKPDKDTQPRMLTIIRGVRVLEISGKAASEKALGAGPEMGMQTNRSIGIEVSEKASKELMNVLSHTSLVVATLRSAKDPKADNPQLEPEMKDYASSSAASGGPAVAPGVSPGGE